MSRFAPENGNNYVRTFDLHVEGDVGIGDLVYAGTYWSQGQRSIDEYSNYVQYSNVSPFNAADIQSFACATGPTIQETYLGIPQSGQSPFSGCQVPEMFYIYNNNTQRLVERGATAIQAGRAVPLAGGSVCGKDRRAVLAVL